jgi:cyclopropane fatty-acyl-phospholipid synthase-like methyltransferase
MNIKLVKNGYNQIAEKYLQDRDQFKNIRYLEKFIGLLKPGSKILDIGCGAGQPIDEYLIKKGFKVIGIDISEKQIELARQNVPMATFKVKDMSLFKHGEYNIEAVVSFYAIFHILRENHLKLFKIINSFLPKDGLILVSMGFSEWEGTEDDFHGAKMFWSHYNAKKNKEIIKKAGFKVLLDEIDTSRGEKHQMIIARKTNLKD